MYLVTPQLDENISIDPKIANSRDAEKCETKEEIHKRKLQELRYMKTTSTFTTLQRASMYRLAAYNRPISCSLGENPRQSSITISGLMSAKSHAKRLINRIRKKKLAGGGGDGSGLGKNGNLSDDEDEDESGKKNSKKKFKNFKSFIDYSKLFDDKDFKDEDDEEISKAVLVKDTENQARYRSACMRLKVKPVKMILKKLDMETLCFRNNFPDDVSVKALCVPLLNNTTIRKLDLSCNCLSTISMKYISELIAENVFIQEFNISDNKFEDEAFDYLSKALIQNSTIWKLDISNTNLADHNIHYIIDVLKLNKQITNLNMSRNSLNEIGCERLSMPIAKNDTITDLDLSWNNIRRKGASAICKSLCKNAFIERVNLSWNGFYLEGSMGLSRVFSMNKILKEIDISHNRIDLEALNILLKGFKKNITLVKLNIKGNPFLHEGASKLIQTIHDAPLMILEELNISDQWIEPSFIDKLQAIKSKRKFIAIHGPMLTTEGCKDKTALNSKQFENDDPMTVLMECMRLQNLRLVDLFTALDKDGSGSLDRDEFKSGLLNMNIPLSPTMLDSLLDSLDENGDGQVDFLELTQGQKAHKLRLLEISATKKETRFEDTEVGRVSAKLQRLMAVTSYTNMAKKKLMEKSNVTS